jgi:hypothetical protein
VRAAHPPALMHSSPQWHMRNAARRFFLRVAHHDLRFWVYISRLFMTSKVRTQPCHIGMSAAWSR